LGWENKAAIKKILKKHWQNITWSPAYALAGAHKKQQQANILTKQTNTQPLLFDKI